MAPDRTYYAAVADHLIVGAGSAGCVLAARLTEDPSTTVTLLEAGPDWRPADAGEEVRSLNPSHVIANPKFDELQWPTLTASRVDGQRHRLFWRGRGVGGSSTVNGIIAIRPVPDDWDRWGQPGWSHDDVLPYLCRLERDADFGDEPYHGADGPFPVFRMPRDRWGPVDGALWSAALGHGPPGVPGPQRADRHRRLALRHRRGPGAPRAGHRERRLPGGARDRPT